MPDEDTPDEGGLEPADMEELTALAERDPWAAIQFIDANPGIVPGSVREMIVRYQHMVHMNRRDRRRMGMRGPGKLRLEVDGSHE